MYRGTSSGSNASLARWSQASPGYTMLDYYGDAEAGRGRPLAGRGVAGCEYIATPIAPSDEAVMRRGVDPTILLPDGRVIQQYGDTWPNEAAWRAAMDKGARRKRS